MAVVIGIARYANASWVVNWPHLNRSYIVTTFAILSFLLIAFATIYDKNKNFFWVAVGASVFTGFSQGLGEAAFLGFLKGFPSRLVGDVSCGTGMAGLFGTAMLLSLKAIGFSNQAIYLIAIPTMIVYQWSYIWLSR